MKKMICLSLGFIMVFSIFSFLGCNKTKKTLRMGLGIQTSVTKATDATEDKEGQGTVEITAAVITIDQNDTVAACIIDTAENTVKYTYEGKAITNTSFQTKYERGDRYGMEAYGGAEKEWYEQVQAFTSLIQGKTLSQIKAMVAADGKGSSDVIAAGCTIAVKDFVLAVEKAYNNALDSEASRSHRLALGIYTEQSTADAEDDKIGKNQVETTFFAAAVNTDGKMDAVSVDCAQIVFAFDEKGISSTDITKEIFTKRQLGDSYNMKLYGGAGKEWYMQADTFAAACIDQKAGDIAALMGEDNYGTADLKKAGCTILVNGFVKAASKIK